MVVAAVMSEACGDLSVTIQLPHDTVLSLVLITSDRIP